MHSERPAAQRKSPMNPILRSARSLFAIAAAASLLNSPMRSAFGEESTEEQIAAELANPLSPITTFSMQYRAEFGNGPDNDLNHQLRLQPSVFKPFHDTSAFLLRTAIPLRATEFPNSDGGLGDISLIPYYVPDVTTSTFVGYGGTFTFPTATEEFLGAQKWSAGPAMIVAQVGDPIVYGALVQHLWSYAGDEDRRAVSVSTLQLFLTYLLGGGLSATINSESSCDFQGEAGSRWIVPLALGVSRVVGVDDRYFNVGLGFVSYLERPNAAADYEVRVNFTYVLK